MLTIITPTGSRPEAFAHCQRWMQRQDYAGAVRWVIVDDGEEPQEISLNKPNWLIDVLRPQPLWSGKNTQGRNLLAALDVIHGDQKVVIIEDDDWYAPDWLSTVDKALDKHELVGETIPRYYNVAQRKWQEFHLAKHSSLCATAMRGSALTTFRSLCRPAIQFIDVMLWEAHGNNCLIPGRKVVGIKGLPGRNGIGVGHSKRFQGHSDSRGKILKEWIGQDAKFYLNDSTESDDDEEPETISWVTNRGD